MNVVLYGATGKVGSRILKELLARGHQTKAVVREPTKLGPAKGLSIEPGDLGTAGSIVKASKGADAVVSAYGPPVTAVEELISVTDRLIEGVRQAGVPRLLTVGGAASLEVAPGVQLIDTDSFPESWKPIARAHREALQKLKASNINWTCLSPSVFLEPGDRTGKFRLGHEQLLANEKGESRISMEDYAIALVDEIETPKHQRQRFTVGY
jgi:putative NADH-flavin reductase